MGALAALPPSEVRFATRPRGFRWGLWRGSAGVWPLRRPKRTRFSAAFALMMALEAQVRVEALRLGHGDEAVRLRAAVNLLVATLRREVRRVERARARNERRAWDATFGAPRGGQGRA